MPLPTRNTIRDYAFGRCVIQSAARQLLVDGQPARLGARAFDVLMALIERRDAVVSKHELLDIVWPGLVVEENNLQVQVSTLRKLLGPQTIVTIPGRGYRFSAAPAEVLDSGPPDGGQATAASASAPSAYLPPGNLPVLLPPLFGREAELATLATMLQPGPTQQLQQVLRLITITGAGGMGKTRLAQAAALAASQDKVAYRDGVWLVELASVSDGQLVLGSLARSLGMALDAEASAQDLASRIADRQMLIVLDNCEHVLAPVAVIATTLLRSVPALRLLATSQEPLKLAAEHVLRLSTLAVPATDEPDSPSVETADSAIHADRGYGALQLFAARAQEAVPQFVLNADNRAAVTEICRRLDGIPLAIEFAAARLPLLGLEGLRLRLDDRFRLLTGGTRLAPKRQQTLRAALEWSHSLLSADEQKVFRRLGIFAGSFGLDAAQQVGSDGDFDVWSVLDHLGALVDKSLVISEAGVVPRYRLLESARIFALEHLEKTGESANASRRHAGAVLKHFETAHAQLWVLDSDELLAATLPDIDNLRAALTWAAGNSGDSMQLVALVGASGWLWKPANLRAEGSRWYETAVAQLTPQVPAAVEARLLLGYASLAQQSAAERELAALNRAAALYRAIGNRRGLYETLTVLAQKQVWARELASAEQSIDEATSLIDPAWPRAMREGLLLARTYLLEVSGHAAAGQPLMEELVALMRSLGDQRKLDLALMQLAESLFIQGKATEAIKLRREMVRRVDYRRVNYAGANLGNLCAALAFQGELDEALETARAAMPMLQYEGILPTFADHFALLACGLGRHADAARLLGRSDANFRASGFAREESELRAARMTLASLRQALPADVLERLMIEGAAMTDEAAVRIALGAERRSAVRAA